MRIIRPYGKSVTSVPAAGTARQRRLEQRSAPEGDGATATRDIATFAGTHEPLVIAQWISAIDKIATKPRGDGRPTSAQRALRTKLGDAAWALIEEKGLLRGLEQDADGYLAKLWRFKVHPYPDDQPKPRQDRNGRVKQEPSPKGRWYARFAGGAAPDEIDAAEIASRIFEHLYVAEYRLAEAALKKRQGRIGARAESIAGNVLLESSERTRPTWSAADEAGYVAKVGNIALAIHMAAVEREEAKRRVGPDVAAAVLHRAWADLFDGAPPTFKDARDRSAGLVELHEAIRDRYRRTLKRHRKHPGQVSKLLPKTMGELFRLVGRTLANRDVNHLVRLGKVIHYETAARHAAEETSLGDAPAHVLTPHWASNVDRSRYWSSEGQAEIKRNEAFVRVWRHGIALAAQTLRDWGDPDRRFGDERNDDVLLKEGKEALTGVLFDPRQHARKVASALVVEIRSL